MATRSRIGIENDDGSVSSVYCHWDGYPNNNGVMLERHYKNRDKVKKLIELGSLSSLAPLVDPTKETHSFNNPEEDVVKAYHRDRGDSYDKPRIDSSKESYFSGDIQEYGYLFTKEGKWVVCDAYRNREITDCSKYLMKNLAD